MGEGQGSSKPGAGLRLRSLLWIGALVVGAGVGVALGGPSCGHAPPVAPKPRVIAREPVQTVRPEEVEPIPALAERLPLEWPAGVTPLENLERGALDPVFVKMGRIDRGQEGVVLRSVQYGDSHTAADFLSGNVRRLLQTRFGDAGHGFMLPGKPWRSYRHMDAESGVSNDRYWDAERIRYKHTPADLKLGYGGVTVWTDHRGATLWHEAGRDGYGEQFSKVEVFYLKQPGGARFSVSVDGKKVGKPESTAAAEPAPGYLALDVTEGAHKVEVENLGPGQLRLFGVVMERATSGVVYDSVGINGARASLPLQWDAEFWKQQLSHRAPDLLITAYGTNEVDDALNYEEYGERFEELLNIMKAGAPDAACLVLGPPDRAWKVTGEALLADAWADALARAATAGDKTVWDTPQNLVEIHEAQRAAAQRAGCGFFSLYDAMGGRGAIDRWARSSPPLATGDRVHLTRDGYQQLAESLTTSLLTAFAYYQDEPRVAEVIAMLAPLPDDLEGEEAEAAPPRTEGMAGAGPDVGVGDGPVRPEPVNVAP